MSKIGLDGNHLLMDFKQPDLEESKKHISKAMIPWNMWSHRNHVLHQQGTTIHKEESQAIVIEIQLEYNWNKSSTFSNATLSIFSKASCQYFSIQY